MRNFRNQPKAQLPVRLDCHTPTWHPSPYDRRAQFVRELQNAIIANQAYMIESLREEMALRYTYRIANGRGN